MYVTPCKATKHYNVSPETLRHWARSGKIKYYTTKGGHRRYYIGDELRDDVEFKNEHGDKIIYAFKSGKKV